MFEQLFDKILFDLSSSPSNHGESARKPFFVVLPLSLKRCQDSLDFFFIRRQESQYEMTGLYSETQDDSSADLPQDSTESESLPSTITVTTTYEPQSVTVSTTLTNPAVTTTSITSPVAPDTVIKCHSRQPSSTVDREKTHQVDDIVDEELLEDCGILSCRPAKIQKLARIKVRKKKKLFPAAYRQSFFFCFIFRRFLCFFSPCSSHCSRR